MKGNYCNWKGCCYLAYVVRHMRAVQDLVEVTRTLRVKRGILEAQMIAFPYYGTGKAASELITTASAMETLANATAGALVDAKLAIMSLNAEMVAIRTMALQNPVALNFILAEIGATCAIIKRECYIYIPDESSNITDLATQISQEINTICKVGSDTMKGAQ